MKMALICLAVLVVTVVATTWEEGTVHEVKSSRLSTFKFINCAGPKPGLISVKHVDVAPDPLDFPGTMRITFNGSVEEMIGTPLKAEVILDRKLDRTWIRIPCINQIGSCTFDDLCELLSWETCPISFDKIPCRCPFRMGIYTMFKTAITVNDPVFPPGDYHAKATLSHHSTFVGCFELYVSFS